MKSFKKTLCAFLIFSLVSFTFGFLLMGTDISATHSAYSLLNPISGTVQGAGYGEDEGHYGIDLYPYNYGDPVHAVASGTLTYSCPRNHTKEYQSGDDLCTVKIMLDEPIVSNGITYVSAFYTHMSALVYDVYCGYNSACVEERNAGLRQSEIPSGSIHLEAGDVIGYVGKGNGATHLHLSFEASEADGYKMMPNSEYYDVFGWTYNCNITAKQSVSSLSNVMAAYSTGGVKAKLDQFMKSYPDGSFWTGKFDGASECYGFAGMAIYNIFGKSTVSGKTYRWWNYAGVSTSGMNVIGSITNYSSGNVQSLLSKARCGDILQFDKGENSQHSMIVYQVDADGVWIYDCNWVGYCEIDLRKVSFGAWANRRCPKLTLLRSDNYDTIDQPEHAETPGIHWWLSDSCCGASVETWKVGNYYYFCYELYDSVTGKHWDEVESSDYTIKLTFYNPDGSVKKTDAFDYDQSCISSFFSESGTYTASVVISGDYVFETSFEFTIQENPKKVHSSTNSISLNLSGTKSQTLYLWSSGYYSGNAVWNWSSNNSNISCSWGEWTEDNRLPLTVNAKFAGSATLTIALKDKETGTVLDSINIPVVIKADPMKINSSKSSVSLKLGETESETIYVGYSGYHDGNWVLKYECSNSNVSCTWGEWTDDHRSPLTIKAKSRGTTTVTISIKDKDTGAILDSTTVTVTIDAKSYTVSYNANGGSGAPSSQTKYHNTTLTLSSTKPTRTGHTFLGWSTSSTATSATYQPGGNFTSNANTTLYAVWKADPLKVNSSTNSISLNLSGTKSQTIYLWSSGYYAGTAVWNCSTNNSNVSCSWGERTEDNRWPLTVNAKFAGSATLTIALKDKETGTVLDSINIPVVIKADPMKVNSSKSSVSLKLGETESETIYVGYSGYYDGNWVLKYECSNSNVSCTWGEWTDDHRSPLTIKAKSMGTTTVTISIKDKDTGAILDSITVTVTVGAKSYTVSYNANGGSGAPSSQTKYHNTTLTLSSTKPTRTGHTFLGWSTSSTATSATYQPGGNFTSNANTTLYAVWKADPLKVNSSTNSISLNLSGTKSQTIYLWSSGYYSGKAVWNWSSNNSNVSCSWGEWTEDNRLPLTVNAKFAGPATLTIALKDKETGTVLDSINIPVVINVNPTALSVNSANNAVVSTGGEMKYFTFTPTTSGKYVIYSTGSDDTKVYLYNANWSEVTNNDNGGADRNFRLEYTLSAGTKYIFGVKYYDSSKTGTIPFKFGKVFTITYNANGGSGTPSAQSKDYGTNITLSSITLTRSGYKFLGWSTSSTATSATYQPGDSFTGNANTTLYAVWRAVYTVTFNTNGGSTVASQNVLNGEKVTKPNDPTKTGYIFKGWTLNGSTYNFNSTVTGNITLEAVWESVHICKNNLTKVKAKAATCTQDGNAEYYFCSCGKYYTDFSASVEIVDKKSVIIKAGHEYGNLIEQVDAVHTVAELKAGMKAHYLCRKCNSYFTFEKIATTKAALEIKAPTHDFININGYKGNDGHANTCSCGAHSTVTAHNPNIPAATESEDQKCVVCGYIIATKLSHVHAENLTKVNAKHASCTEDGNLEYYRCSCGRNFKDAYAATEIVDVNSVVVKAGHNYGALVEHVDPAHSATELKTGMKAHYCCDRCGTYFNAEKVATTEAELIIAAPTHTHSADWYADEDEHWNECDCGNKANIAPHADENKDDKCDICHHSIITSVVTDEATWPDDTTAPSEITSAPTQQQMGGDALWIVIFVLCGAILIVILLLVVTLLMVRRQKR